MSRQGRRLRKDELNKFDKALFACREAQRPSDPEMAEAWDKLVPLDPGWEDRPCELCGLEVRVGVRQLAQMQELQRDDYKVVCMSCAVRIADAVNASLTVRHLGGR